jgi:hypothetical protein
MEELRVSVSRHPDDIGTLQELTEDGFFVVKADIGALGIPGNFFSSDLTAFVAGDPILQTLPDAMPLPRSESIQTIACDLVTGQHHSLRSCRGTFCAVVYESSAHRVHLITDKLGIRPIYCWVSPDYIVFATALRILEAVSFCKKSINLLGTAETACYGYPLSDRTPYQNIFSLLAGEVVSVDADGLRRQNYWRWDELPAPAPSDILPSERIYRHFQDAVKVRLGEQKTAAAFLSGGLDSRAIVAALKGAGAKVFTANFGPPGSQDQVLGQLAADRLGSHHSYLQQRALVEGDPYSKATVRDWLNSAEYLAHAPQHPCVVWSGDGGSVGLGHVYLNPDIIAATRAGDLQGAVDKFMSYNRWGLPVKLLKRHIATALADMVNQGILSELKSVQPADPGRIFHLFLMLNDQRRHMFNHFENLDLTRIEFEMPFFDGEFMTEVLREAIDPFLRHVFYLEWLKCFPPGVLETPWQAYPNHVPCPLQQPAKLSYQWDSESTLGESKDKSDAALSGARKLLCESGFSREFLRYGHMRLFMLLMHFGKAEHAYLLHVPSVIYRYWSRSLAATDSMQEAV